MVKINVPLPEPVELFLARASNTAAHLDATYGLGSLSLTASLGYWTKFGLYTALAMLVYVVLEQIVLQYRRWRTGGQLSGPLLAFPLIGSIGEMIMDPHGFWEKQRKYAPSGLSWNSVAGYFMLFATKTDITRKILSENGEDSFKMILHPNGWKILGESNIAFKSGKVHKALRSSFITLFTRKALGMYLSIQDRLIHQRMKEWFAVGKEFDMRLPIRDLNLRTSQLVFMGDYLKDHDAFGALYLLMTEGFLSFPICLPGTGLWKAINARVEVVKILKDCVIAAKKHIRGGGEPTCLLDFWTQRVLEEVDEADRDGQPHPLHSEDTDMAEVMMDFLFASQDASTASLTWTMAFMADYPDMRDRVVQEQKEVRPNNEPFTYELLEKMYYTRAVVKEILRFRPPAVMVPNLAMKDMRLSDDYVAPKGSLVIPSLWAACFEGFPNAEQFDPDRMMPEREEDQKYKKNFLPFGVGPHMCVGKEYAINHLMCFLGTMATHCTWTRRRTSKSDKIQYLPTIYPGDCLITLKPF